MRTSGLPSVRRPDATLARRGGAVELLRLPAVLFGVVSALRGAFYDRGVLPVERLEVPVVSVGNLSAGGTGKTPAVVAVAQALVARGLRPGVLSRGYKAAAGGPSDEARVLARRLPGVPHVEDSDRARGGRSLVDEHRCDVVVLDDGFQHRRLWRDLDLVLVDATRPWGLPAPPEGGAHVRALLPRGLLRERPGALGRADAIVLTRVDQVGGARRAVLEDELRRSAPGTPILAARHRPSGLRALDGSMASLELDALRGRTVDLVSGIGNPEAFEATVHALGADVGERRRFPDHHAYGAGDLDGLGRGGRWILTTEKDAVKLAARSGVQVLEVEFVVDEGRGVLDALFDALPAGRALRERRSLHEGLHG